MSLIGTLGLMGCTGHSNPESVESKPLTLGLTYIPNVQFAPFYLAEDAGFFSGVTLRHHGSDEGLFNALLSGSEDAVVAFIDEVTLARATGAQLVVAGRLYRQYPVEIVARKDIKTWKDLRGKTIGIPGKYGSSWIGLQIGLAKAGLKLSDVNIAEIGYTQQVQLATGKVDAIVGFSNNDTVRAKLAGLEVNRISLPSDLPAVGAVLVTRTQLATQRPRQLEALLDAMAKGIDQSIQDPKSAIEATKKRDASLSQDQALTTAQAVAKATAELLQADGFNLDAAQPGKALEVSQEQVESFVELLKNTDLGTEVNLDEVLKAEDFIFKYGQ